MLGDWIRMGVDLWTKAEVQQVVLALGADKLRMGQGHAADKCAVIGALYRLWSLADQHTTNGLLAGYTAAAIDAEVGLPGFARAVAEAGWLKLTEEGVELTRFDRFNSRSAKRRAADAARKANVRREADKPRTKSGQPEDQERDREREVRTSTEVRTPSAQMNPSGKRTSCAATDAARPRPKKRSYPEAFEEWWKLYPRKTGKLAAMRAWEQARARLRQDGREVAFLDLAAEQYAAAVKRWPPDDRRFIPHPATWLNQGRYDDDPLTWERGKKGVSTQEIKTPVLDRLKKQREEWERQKAQEARDDEGT
jgi:hypothetical protein